MPIASRLVDLARIPGLEVQRVERYLVNFGEHVKKSTVSLYNGQINTFYIDYIFHEFVYQIFVWHH